MIKIEAITLEDAYSKAATELNCSVTELVVEVVQYPSSGVLGLFRKKAVIVATKKAKKQSNKNFKDTKEIKTQTQKPVATQDELQEEIKQNTQEQTAEVNIAINEAIEEIKEDIKLLFDKLCFKLDEVKVDIYDENTVYIELNGEDAALLIGKEGYRYKALSYMLFNWINAKYSLGLRLEIAEFLKNQEEAVNRYLQSVKESVDRDGRAQTKILDGVLVQIALRELRAMYPDKYVAIRSTRDGLKYIIINDYNY
jgi:spoIIIJ-associated protein